MQGLHAAQTSLRLIAMCVATAVFVAFTSDNQWLPDADMIITHHL